MGAARDSASHSLKWRLPMVACDSLHVPAWIRLVGLVWRRIKEFGS